LGIGIHTQRNNTSKGRCKPYLFTLPYLCGRNSIGIIDVTNPASPALLSSFGQADLGGTGFLCRMFQGNKLAVVIGSGGSASILTYDVSNPTSPVKLAGPVPVNAGVAAFISELEFNGNTGFFTTDWFNFVGNTIISQHGDFFDYDFSNPASPTFLNTLTGAGDAASNLNTHFGIAFTNSTTALFASTTATGSTTNGQAKIVVADISNPASLNALSEVLIPQASWAIDIVPQGNIALVVGNTQGWTSGGSDFFPHGNLTLTALDVSSPRNPVVVSTVVTSISTIFAGGVVPLGNNRFAVLVAPPDSNLTGPGQLLLVDASNPANLTFTTGASVPGVSPGGAPPQGEVAFAGNNLYVVTTAGLNVYSLSGAVEYTATVQVPTTGKVIYNAGSFSTAPAITHGSGVDTLTWTNPGTNTITWTSNVTGIQPADVLPVANGGSVNFTVPAGSGTITLPAVNINSGQILGISPATQTVAPGGSATYTLTASNPTNSAVTYNLGIAGVPSRWVTLPATVNVPASGSTNVTLTLQTAFADVAGASGFQITAGVGSVSGSVNGTLVIQGTANIGAPVSSNALGVAVALTPASATGGQGTTANYVVQVTNAGNVADTYNLTASLPSGVTGTFDQTSVQVPPGLSNFRQVNLHLQVPRGATAASPTFTVKATSTTSSNITGRRPVRSIS
jgi:hypothetical protein